MVEKEKASNNSSDALTSLADDATSVYLEEFGAEV